MSLNLDSKETHIIFDEYNMALVKGDELSWRDSLGRTILAWIAYGMPAELSNSIRECIYSKKKYILLRHPEFSQKASRDHWSYFIIYRKLFYEDVTTFSGFLDFVPRMRGIYNWMRAIAGDKRAEWWYYFWNIPFARLGTWWLRTLRKIGRIKSERDNLFWAKYYDFLTTKYKSWGEYIQDNRTKWQKLWAWIIFKTIPAYSLHIKAWQLYVMPKTPKRDTLCKILIKRVGKSNLMLRLLFASNKTQNSGVEVTQEEIDAYPNMTNYRPGVYLDETCRRDIREMTPEEAAYNTYEVDLIKYLWNKKCR